MKRLLLLLALLPLVAGAREVTLSAIVAYENGTDTDIGRVSLKVHAPPQTFYQKLTDIAVLGPGAHELKRHAENPESNSRDRFTLRPSSSTN